MGTTRTFWPLGRPCGNGRAKRRFETKRFKTRPPSSRPVFAALSALCFAVSLGACSPPTGQNQDSSSAVSGDLSALHPDVRAAVLRAREAEAAAEDSARRARDAASQGQAAADRARRGEAGFLVGAIDPSDPGSARYEGAADANGVPTGFGVHYSGAGSYQGDTRAGEFGDASRARPGVYRYGDNANANAALRYEGDFLNVLRAGYGVTFWRDGARTSGLYRDGGIVTGVYVFPDGRRYEGDFENGVASGHGVQWDAHGAVALQGLWQDDQLVAPLAP